MSTSTITEPARQAAEAAEARYNGALDTLEQRIAALPDTATASEVDAIERALRPEIDAAEAARNEARTRVTSTARIAEARSRSGLIPTGDFSVSEPDLYTPTGEHSFIRDLYAARTQGDSVAASRLQRHTEERRRSLGAEGRASFGTTDFYPPAWADTLWVQTKRQKRVVANLVQNLPLPPYGNTLEIPAYNAAPADAAGVQSADGQSVTSNAPSTANLLTAPVSTYAGYLDVPRQTVERGLPGLDMVVFGDITNDVNRKLDLYSISGSGGSGQPTGIVNTSGIINVSFTNSLTVANFYAHLADAVQQIQTAVFESPDGIIAHPRRIGWLLAQVDSDGRPLMVPNQNGPYNSLGVVTGTDGPMGSSGQGDTRPAGWIMGIPVYPDANITTVAGASTNQDILLVGSFKNAVLWEDGSPRQFTFEGVASDHLNLRLQVVHYASFLVRYPAAFAVIGGSSLTPPTF